MKKLAYAFILAVVFGVISGQSFAQSVCGGEIVYHRDCDGNNRKWGYKCCPTGYRVQGVWYADMSNGQDYTDSLGPICRKVGADGNPMLDTADRSGTGKRLECDKNEVFAGIAYKDVVTNHGGTRDAMDGITAWCQNAKTGALRRLPNNDIDKGPKHTYSEEYVRLPQRVKAILYKERDNGGDNPGGSDRADCATIAVSN
ncbi:hypothetical protein K1X76_12955 [bacterium]|nr:hypothetical protein [bacterium]